MNRFLLYSLSFSFTILATAQKTKITVKKVQNDNDSVTVIEKEISSEEGDFQGIQMWVDSVIGEAPIFLQSFNLDENIAFDKLLDSIFNHTDEINDFFRTFSFSDTEQPYNRGFLGVYFEDQELSEGSYADGITISKVIPQSAAELAGLQVGDILLQIDDLPIHIIPDATNYIGKKKVEDKIKIIFLRDNRTSETFAVLKSRSDLGDMSSGMPLYDKMPFYADKSGFVLASSQPKLGLQLQNLDSEAIEDLKVKNGYGVQVIKVMPNSAANKMGFKINDVITTINNQKVYSADDLRSQMAKIDIDKSVDFDIVRYGKNKKLSGKISEYNSIPNQD